MAKSFIVLKELEQGLRYWEDLNLFASGIRSLFQLNFPFVQEMIGGFPDFNPIFNGTELNQHGFFVRPIKSYKTLRLAVGKLEFDPEAFLPNVTKEMGPLNNRLNLARSKIFSKEVNIFPYMLLEWVRTKKVFAIDDISSIPIVDPNTNNYLPLLPHSSFVMKFSQPLEFETEESGGVRTFHYVYLCFRRGANRLVFFSLLTLSCHIWNKMSGNQ